MLYSICCRPITVIRSTCTTLYAVQAELRKTQLSSRMNHSSVYSYMAHLFCINRFSGVQLHSYGSAITVVGMQLKERLYGMNRSS